MKYSDSRGFTDSQDNQKYFDRKYLDKNSGPYLATVKFTEDPERMGRLGVNIPALSGTREPSADQITWCQYLSPFYGVKPLRGVNKTDPYSYKGGQTSYGMWAVPPDIDTTVMVIFAQGDTGRPTAFWMGCVQEPLTNQQIPGHAASSETAVANIGGDVGQSKQELYGTDTLPTGEKNRQTEQERLEQQKFPINERLAEQLLKEGLISDQTRGTTSSSARRESPSAVFGISTPGRIDAESPPLNIGLDGSAVKVNREHGHSFVMDDGAEDGSNQLTRIRTSSGHQILMHDTEGTVYIANGSGKAFIEMERDGTVSLYSAAGINLRTGQDFNLHSDRDINFHAKRDIKFTAENNLDLNAEGYVLTMGDKGILSASQSGSVRNYARDGISSYTDGTQLHGSAGRIDLAGSQVHFNSVGASSTWGPKWLKPDADAVSIKVTEGNIDVDSEEPIKAGQVNKIENKTTVSEFVTHEPYDRQSSTARIKKFIEEAISEIKKDNPQLTSQELSVIKKQLQEQPSVKAVSNQLSKLVKLNDKIKLTKSKLLALTDKAKQIDDLIKGNIKNKAINFVQGQVAKAIDSVKNFFRF